MSGGGGPFQQVAQQSQPAPVPIKQPWEDLAVNTQQGYNQMFNANDPVSAATGQQGGNYNRLLGMGFDNSAIRSSAETTYGPQSEANWNRVVQEAGMNSPTGRPMAGSAQFFQPVYQPQYQSYTMTNPMAVSQYNQPMNTFYGGYQNSFAPMYNPYQMQPEFNPYTNSFQTPFSQQRLSSGPQQAIVSRSYSMRGTPAVMARRASGGIADLVSE